MNSVIEALKSNAPLSVARCDELLTQVNTRNSKVSARIADIHPGRGNAPQARVRTEALTTGTIEDVRALDAEFDDLSLEAARLQAQKRALQNLRDRSQAREAAASIPQHHAKLDQCLDQLATTQKAFLDAFSALDQEYQDTWHAYSAAANGGHKPQDAPPELIERLLQVDARPRIRSRLSSLSRHVLAEEIGIKSKKEVAA